MRGQLPRTTVEPAASYHPAPTAAVADKRDNFGQFDSRLVKHVTRNIMPLSHNSPPSARRMPVLEAAFVAWLVALLGDRTVRGANRLLLGDPDRRRLESALAQVSKVAIAAMLRDIPSESREELSNILCERFKLGPVTTPDGHTRVRTALVNAIREQISPLGERIIIRSAEPFPDEAADDGISLADALADIAIRSIEQLGTRFSALTPLIAQLNADAAAERDEAIGLKVDMILALLEQRMQMSAVTTRVSRPDKNFIPGALDRLADALLKIPSIFDDSSRNEILRHLPDPLRSAIPRSSVPRVQIYGILETCGTYLNGLRDLRSVIYSFERDSLPMRHFDEVILEIGASDQSQHPPDPEADGRA